MEQMVSGKVTQACADEPVDHAGGERERQSDPLSPTHRVVSMIETMPLISTRRLEDTNFLMPILNGSKTAGRAGFRYCAAVPIDPFALGSPAAGLVPDAGREDGAGNRRCH